MLIKGSFKQQNILWEVYFKSELYPEVSLEIGSSPDGLFENSQNFQVYFSSDAVEVTTESPEDTFQTIIKHSATVNLLTKTYIGQYFWSESPLDIRVEIFRNSEIIFSGFVTQGSYSQSYADCYDELNISCVDYLSVLEYYNYADISHNYDSYKTSASNVSFQKIFNNLLIDGLDFHLGQKSSLYYDQSKDSVLLKNTIFDDIEFSELNFLGDDEDSVNTKEDVLSKILTYLNLHIVQLGKDYLIFDWDFINNVSEGLATYIDLWDRSKTFTKSLLTSPDYPELIKRFHYSSSSTNLSIADVYNKIQVNCALDSTDDAIVSPFDDEVTTQIYPKKYLYQTEVLSGKASIGSSKQFLDYVKDGNKSVNDEFTVIDYYIQQISNPAWTLFGGHDVQKDFTVVHQDILKYVPYNSKGEAYKAYYIPGLFPERFGVTALYSIGCIQKKQADINSDMSKISPNSLQMSPYIVISVNGNGDDSENGHKPTDQDLIDAVPIAEYTGNISGGVYSPSDDDTTNYMVFSGKIMFVPRTWSELTLVWDGVKQVDNFISLLSLTVPYYKDEGKTLRTNKFYTVDNPSSIQDDSKFDGSSRDFTDLRRSPYLDLSFVNSQDKVKWFQYNYTRLEDGSGSSIDNIKKLSVFECQLVIGDKTFVETVNQDGSSTYSWETYNPAYDLTVNQQSFTLGIDPNKGDYILGQDFEIENNITFDMNLGSNKGFAIPIKKSDNLKGNIVFKILGPYQLQWNDITRRHHTMFRHTKYTDNDKYVLANCSSIVIKDFNCKLISDNSGLEVNNEKDLIYVSTEDKKFTNSYETDFDITSGLSSQECYEKQINNKVYMNYPVTTKGEVVTKIVNKNYQVKEGEFLQDKPEKFYIDQYFREYSKPRIIFQVPVREKLFTNKPMIDLFGSFVCFQTFRDRSFKLIGIDYSSDDEQPRNLTFKELPEEFGKPADDYDWTDNSETGGEDEIDKGGPNESIEVDQRKIADYFTITNTGTAEIIDFTIKNNSNTKVKYFYYTLDDIKWVKKYGDLDVSLSPGSKIRLRCIFNSDAENKSFFKFICESPSCGFLNASGDIQSLSAGDDFKNQNRLATRCVNLFANLPWSFNGLKLPSKNIYSFCYQHMFENCTNLTSAPDLPAETLSDYCYSYMFSGCTNLQSTAKIFYSQTAERSCEYMYMGCTSLLTANAEIFSDNIILTNECYWGMFQNCTKLGGVTIKKQDLTGADGCFSRLFTGCSSLTSIKYYPKQLGEQINEENYTYEWVDGVAETGYWYNANNQDFNQMGTSLIPNGWIIQKISEVTEDEKQNCFTVKLKQKDPIYVSLCDVHDDYEPHPDGQQYVIIGWYINKSSGYTIEDVWFTTNDKEWQHVSANTYILINNYIRFKCKLKSLGMSGIPLLWRLFKVSTSFILPKIEISGNVDSIINTGYIGETLRLSSMFNIDLDNPNKKLSYTTLELGDFRLGSNIKHAYICDNIFENCTGITKIPDNLFTNDYPVSYDYMFKGCTGITAIPENLFKQNVYSKEGVFEGCTGITAIPENLLKYSNNNRNNNGSYKNMFKGCTGITTIPDNFFSGYGGDQTCESMFEGCTSLKDISQTIFDDLTNKINHDISYSGSQFITMFKNCKKLENITLNFNNIEANECKKMFEGCSEIETVSINIPKSAISNSYPNNFCNEMFKNCSKIKFMSCNVPSWQGEAAVGWVTGVNKKGVFVANNKNISYNNHVNHVPINFEIYREYLFKNYFLIFNKNYHEITITAYADYSFQYMINPLGDQNSYFNWGNNPGGNYIRLSKGDFVIMKGNYDNYTKIPISITSTGNPERDDYDDDVDEKVNKIVMYGNLKSLYFGDDFELHSDQHIDIPVFETINIQYVDFNH